MSIRWILCAVLTAFSVTLALVLGQRLSSDALALVLGVTIGVTVTLPSQYFLFRLAHRTAVASPNPIHSQTARPILPVATSGLSVPPQRHFTFIGDETTEMLTALTID
jgi:hypothetical protein